jgi:NIMA (never in mitosis gene a)-related kinase
MFKYEVLKLLGRGAYGRVDLARVKATNEDVAIKKVKLAALPEKQRAKAAEEVRLFSSLHHPNIVAYKDSFQDQKNLYIVMEYVNGGDLEQKITQRGTELFSENEILFTFVQLLVALSYLHTQHILHRDLKPQNVFLTSDGIVKLGDFGVAKALENTTDCAKTVTGTPYYLAPELWESQPYSMPADIWSLGGVLYEMTCLRKPFNGKSPTELLVAVMRNSRRPIPESFSNDLRDLIDNMLAHDAAARPSAAAIEAMPFITTAIQNLITINRGKLADPAAKSARKSRIPTSGGKRIMLPKYVPPKPTTPVKCDAHAIPKLVRPEDQKLGIQTMKSPEVEFPDDWTVDPDEDDGGNLLEECTVMLESSLRSRR